MRALDAGGVLPHALLAGCNGIGAGYKTAFGNGSLHRQSKALGVVHVGIGQQIPRWIPVEERLPEEFATVLVVISTPSGSHVSFMSRHAQDGFWQHADGDIDEINVTHWMPLPEPPEVKLWINDN